MQPKQTEPCCFRGSAQQHSEQLLQISQLVSNEDQPSSANTSRWYQSQQFSRVEPDATVDFGKLSTLATAVAVQVEV